jgi:hypothetical protein
MYVTLYRIYLKIVNPSIKLWKPQRNWFFSPGFGAFIANGQFLNDQIFVRTLHKQPCATVEYVQKDEQNRTARPHQTESLKTVQIDNFEIRPISSSSLVYCILAFHLGFSCI